MHYQGRGVDLEDLRASGRSVGVDDKGEAVGDVDNRRSVDARLCRTGQSNYKRLGNQTFRRIDLVQIAVDAADD
jgi:hypothetical protein